MTYRFICQDPGTDRHISGRIRQCILAVRVSFWTKYEYCWVSVSYWKKLAGYGSLKNECSRGARRRLDGEKKEKRKKNTTDFFVPQRRRLGQHSKQQQQSRVWLSCTLISYAHYYQHRLPPFDHPGKCAKCLWPPIVWFPGIRYHTAAYYHHTTILLRTTSYLEEAIQFPLWPEQSGYRKNRENEFFTYA